MPSSKEVRARQNRQKERVAAQLAERRRTQKRRRAVGSVAAVIILVILVALGFSAGLNNNSKVAVTPTTELDTTPTTAPATSTTLASVKGKPCVGLKDPLPKGSPAMLLAPGPAPTKLATQDLKIGTGKVIPKNAKVTVNYIGVACSNGKIFDSSYNPGRTPLAVDLSSGVIVGWQQGIPGMRIGGVRLLSIPASLAYGSTGNPPIAPDEALFFLVAPTKLG